MKKITLLLALVFACISGSYSQCLNPDQYPTSTVESNNLGLVQEITTCNYTVEYAHLSNILVGEDYLFTCTSLEGGVHKYISVTDMSDNVIAMGESPLTVTEISADDIKVHYTENAECVGETECHVTTIQIVLSCPVPLNSTVSDITTTSASFSWEPGGSEVAWQVLVLPAGSEAPTAETEGTPVTGDPTYTDSSLTPAEGYSFYVRANCGSEFSPWSLAFNFASACNPIATFNENFDSAEVSELPTCWTGLLRGETLSQYASVEVIDFTSVYSSPNAVQLYNEDSDTSGSDDIILVSPNLSTLSLGTHRLKFWAKNGGAIQVGTLDGTSPDAVFTSYEELSVGNTAAEYVVDFSGYSGTDTYVGIRMNTSTSYTSVYIDNILWEVSPSCPDVTEISVASVATDGVSLTWVPGGAETTWHVAVGEASENDPSTLPFEVANGDSNITISGLTSQTDYKVWIRSVCPGPDNGAWIGPIAFSTDCLPVGTFNENFDTAFEIPACWNTILRGDSLSQWAVIEPYQWTFVHSAPYSIRLYNEDSDTDGGDDIILVSPNLSTVGTGTHRLKFWARGFSGNLQVGTLDSNTNAATFSSFEEVALNGDNAVEYTIDFTTFSGTDQYIGFRMNNSQDYSSIYIDDVRWEVAPTCADVSEIAVPVVTTEGATVTWINNGSESMWHVAVGDTSVTDPSTLTYVTSSETSKDVGGLTDGTDYLVWVRSVCPGDDFGVWIGPVAFTTECLPTATFNENFDSVETPDLPVCWSSILRGDSVSQYAFVNTYDFDAVNSEPVSVQMYNDESATSSTDDVMLVSPNLSTLELGTYRVKFFARGAGSLQIGTLDSNTDSSIFTLVEEITTTDNATEYAVNFTSGTSDPYIAFRMNNSQFYSSIYLDDIRWEVAPTCADVVNIAMVDATPTTVDIAWEPGGGEVNWQVVYGGTDVTDPSTLTPSPILTDTFYQLTPLTAATSYNVWVRSVCPADDFGAWIGPLEVSTACVPFAIADTTIEGFEDTTGTNLPICWNSELVSGSNNWISLNPFDGFWDISTTNSGTRIAFKNYQDSEALLYSLPLDYTNVNEPTRVNTYLHRHDNAAASDKYTIYVNSSPTLEGAEQIFELFSSTEAEPTVSDRGFYNYTADIPESFNGQAQVYIILQGVTSQNFSSYALGMDDFSVEFTPTAGTPEVAKNNFNVYPNPVKDVLNVSYTENISNVSVFNILGQKVLNFDLNTTAAQVDLSKLAAGPYVVKVASGNQIKTIKVLKQ